MKNLSKIALVLMCTAAMGFGAAAAAKNKAAKEEKKSTKAQKRALHEECKAKGLKGSELRDCVNSELARQQALQQDAQAH